ncbi:hypothetical protein CHO01_25610 [Cellulomonas hominis]|uniref:Uncharacterized protein n=1 Tax=Cellulomonas hominis TaxID=156981 RepID=A0A511FDW6_9CELL|nr:hypothetical protein [Cellulomonas hominis]MBB5472528.1 hypothetical protein [Cellulomonas hominis]GEL47445.1 hypothetical protein CHO01_25610 [Cellulomonas hominis]
MSAPALQAAVWPQDALVPAARARAARHIAESRRRRGERREHPMVTFGRAMDWAARDAARALLGDAYGGSTLDAIVDAMAFAELDSRQRAAEARYLATPFEQLHPRRSS